MAYTKLTTKDALRISIEHIGENGYSGVTVEAPSAVQAFLQVTSQYIGDTEAAKRAYKELLRQKLLQIEKLDGSFHIALTPNGAFRLMKENADKLTIKPMQRWDGHWRLVCFDIPKGKDKERLYFNRRLHELGFTMIQRSMWAHPYDCFEVIKHITDFCNLTRYISILEVSKLDALTTRKLEKIYELTA